MKGIMISTDRLISATEARKNFGKLLAEISENEKSYYLILENGKLAAMLIHPYRFKKEETNEMLSLNEIRKDWSRHEKEVSQAIHELEKKDKKELPKLLQIIHVPH